MYADDEIRHLVVGLLTAKTSRDMQRRVGASNLSNGCDYCLASNFLGDDRNTIAADRAWMGRVWGTAQHSILEQRATHALNFEGLDGTALAAAREQVQTLLGLHPAAAAERHVEFCTIDGYGPVGGTIDLDLGPDADHLVDYKGSTRKKTALIRDYMELSQGLPPIFGRESSYVMVYSETKPGLYRKAVAGVSERQYAEDMAAMEYKMNGYYGQQTLYMKGAGRHRASIVFLNRDGTGVFDNPAGERYDDPKAMHDIHVLSFDYNADYADALIARAQAIFAHLNGGGVARDFTSHDHCYACTQDSAPAPLAGSPIPNVDIEVQFSTAA